MENNGKGIFYGVIGVATLIVAIIGATFAYFTATTASGQYVTGTAATAGLAVTVTRLTGHSTADTAENYVMVPQKDAYLNLAINGVTEEVGEEGAKQEVRRACIDTAGSLVCSIYKITVENTGSAAIDVSGSIKFFASGDTLAENGEDVEYTSDAANLMQHLKWAVLADPSGNDPIPTALKNSGEYLYAMKVDAALYATGAANGYDAFDDEAIHDAHYDLLNPSDDLDEDLKVDTDAQSAMGQYHLEAATASAPDNQGGDYKEYYIVVWISENNKPQNDYNFGTFLGQVTFNSAGGSGATSTFNENYQA